VSVPVIGNGDVMNAQDAVTKIKNLDGVMVGRGTFGNPWVMKEIVDALDGTNGKLKMDPSASSGGKSRPATFEEKIPWILEHCALAVRFKGERTGMLEMRRHLSSYVKGFDGAKEMREKLVRVEKLDQVKEILCA
jgi:tRNA-dihydrouridine synthase